LSADGVGACSTKYLASCAVSGGAPRALAALARARGGSCRTVRSACGTARARTGLDTLPDGILSVDAAGIYKPSPASISSVDRLGLAPVQIAFVSSNGWDAAGAKALGSTTF